MNLQKQFTAQVETENLFTQKDQLLIAVSGGVDSIVLCDLCEMAGYRFSLAHCNFQLREGESDADELFVKDFAEKIGVRVFIKKFDTETYASANKLSVQVAARELRYEWFTELMQQDTSLKYLLTAHHADDNIETVLMNFFKGAGIKGLKGILPKQQQLVRPLLFAFKEALLEYAAEHQLPYREDSSNSSDKYTRNYFRNQLIPGLQKVFPQVKNNLLDSIERFRQINAFYDPAMQQATAKLVEKKGSEWHIPVLKLLKTKGAETIMHELTTDLGFTAAQLPGIMQLLYSETGKYIQSATHRILRNRNWLIISELGSPDMSRYILEKAGSALNFPNGVIASKILQEINLSADPGIALLDASKIEFPLIIRQWKNGDYFYPLGMQKKKKLSRFFIDNKLSMNQKENTWIVESGKRIAWIIGQRIDDRFKISPNTTSVLQLTLSSK